jgi:hypothetical protein
MKKFVLTIIALTFAASPALAQFGDISAYSDQAGTSCNISDVGSAVHDAFIVLKHNTGGVKVAKFKVTNGTTMVQIGETAGPGTLTIGTAAAGIEVAFTSCQAFDAYIMKVTYFGSGSGAPCEYISVDPHPGSQVPGETMIVDCGEPFGEVHAVPSGQAIVNPGPPPAQCDCNVAAGETTWGSIKALYR